MTAQQTWLQGAVEAAVRAVPPAWPLAATVAVNPFLGQTGETLARTGARLARTAGAPVTMPRAWYRERIATGVITDADLAEALAASIEEQRPASLVLLKAAAMAPETPAQMLPTVADLAAEATGTDWPGILAERLGAWSAAWFDEGQALWAAPQGRSAYDAWRDVATHDLTPEILGLRGFATHVSHAPETAAEALARAAGNLGLDADSAPSYFHRLLMSLGGVSQLARYRLWQAELQGGHDESLRDLLTIRLLWEEALHQQHADMIGERWRDTVAAYAAPLTPTADLVIDGILQEALERAAQRRLATTLADQEPPPSSARPALQAAFCIDVRSERFRRALEAVDPSIRTLGFAGFFGLTTAHRRFASDVDELRLPVLLNPGLHSCSGGADNTEADGIARVKARAKRAWGRFKFAAVSSFAFVEASGPLYVGKLVRDALALTGAAPANDPAPRLDPLPDLAARTAAAETVLRAMSLTEGFARLVLLVGHGATVTNNPHASALQCGACGGYSGEVNARLLASLLNETEVRAGLVGRGIEIPADTLFVAGLHDTVSDEVTLYAADKPDTDHAADLALARRWLAAAGKATRAERALRLPGAGSGSGLYRRSQDWAQVRPEWGLAGCSAFIAAPRGRTAGRSLEGRAFLHDYSWRQDADFRVLELIMTAPVVVASWISLQYYGSTVAPEVFGGGNKLLHNVTGGVGVIEGNGGLLRAGLPWQSVHDGTDFVHEPLRLSVCIEAPREAMTEILRRHEGVRALFDNRWLHLFALDEAGCMAWRYEGDLQWRPLRPVAETLLKEAS
ncbi:MAG: DUF2309 domain-containing protein [Geminicoccaceae bacterium]